MDYKDRVIESIIDKGPALVITLGFLYIIIDLATQANETLKAENRWLLEQLIECLKHGK